VAEIALSMIVLIGCGLLTRSFARLLEVRPGFDVRQSVTMWMNFSGTRYAPDAARIQFVRALRDEVAAMPDVAGAAIANDLPVEGDDTMSGLNEVDGKQRLAKGQDLILGVHAIGPAYFAAMGIPRLRGREFTDADSERAPAVVIVNQKLAETLWPGADPVGHKIKFGGGKPAEVVGVVGNVLHNGLADKPSAETYVPYPQYPMSYVALTIRTPREPASVYAAVRSIVAQLDPELPVHDMRSMDAVIGDTLASRRLTLSLVGGFALLALVLAAMGLYGVMSYTVAARVPELAVRMALGAGRRDVQWLVVRDALALTGLGLAAGAAGAFVTARGMTGLLYMVAPADAATYAVIAAGLGSVALSAAYLPARRATRVDPIVALRQE